MGDRFFSPRHGNLDLLLRRQTERPLPAWTPPGIGHNGGPPLDLPLDMSGTAWAWRRAMARAWAAPPREVALRRLRRAEALGLSYRDFTAALMDTGTSLTTALLPLHELAVLERRQDGSLTLHVSDEMAAMVGRFEGRLVVVADAAVSGALDRATRARLKSLLSVRLGDRVGPMLSLPFRFHDSGAQRAARLRRLLRARSIRRKECFWLGRTPAEALLAEQAGLGFFKPLALWFVSPDRTAAKSAAGRP